MVRHAGQQANSARAYEAIKSSLVAYELPPGSPIPVRVLAENLHVSPRPVRTACYQLVGEGWAIDVGHYGFLAWNPDDNALLGLYEVSEQVLMSAIDVASMARSATLRSPGPVQKVHEDLWRQSLVDYDLATRTGDLFSAIVEVSGNAMAKNLMDECNARLHFLRLMESLHIDDANDELMALCELALVARHDALKRAVDIYFRRRYALLPNLVKLVPTR
ncbi:MAG: GntR family transcriptional regulator [Pseudomonadota bacterium]